MKTVTLPAIYRKKIGICHYCGIDVFKTSEYCEKEGFFVKTTLMDDDSTRDHVTPKSQNGDNLTVRACLSCNQERGNMNYYKFFNLKRKTNARNS